MKTNAVSLKKLPKMGVAELFDPLVIVAPLSKWKTLRELPPEVRDPVLKRTKRLSHVFKAGAVTKIPGIEKGEPDLILAALPEERTTYRLLSFARAVLRTALQIPDKRLGFVLLESKLEARLADAFGSATSARMFERPVYGHRKKDFKPFGLKEVAIYSSKSQAKAFQTGFELGEGTNLVRYLGLLPANQLSPEIYGKEIQKLVKEYKLRLKFYSKTELKKMGAGAFTAVDQGNPDSKGGIYEITYSPRGAKNKKPIHLVGKGLCYDTGGYDVKTSGYMHGMKGDMQGSAVALSTLLTAARLKLPLKMKAYLGVTENHISPKAYKPDDIIVALNGTSIEVVNTDAEGRMVLADTLTIASRGKPALLVDFATLTGCATIAIGTRFSAGFTNEKKYQQKIMDAGEESGERVWTFPLDETYRDSLKSEVADTKQCAKGRGPDHIQAAIFLQKFVEKGVPWVHVDLSAAENPGGLAHADTEFTGFGVRWTVEFLRKTYRV